MNALDYSRHKEKPIQKLSSRIALLVLCITLLVPGESYATHTDSELMLFEDIPVVFSASRIKEPLLEASAAVSIVTAENLEQWGIQDLPDAFRFVPDMDVVAFSGREWSVSARGFGDRFAGRMLVLVDGMSVYYPHFSGTNWHELILHNDDIENVEVVRGANDTGYGFNAYNGVINIKTKDPEKTRGFRGRYTYGSNGWDEFFGSIGEGVDFGDFGRTDFRISYSSLFSQGFGDNNGEEFQDQRNYDTVNLRLKHTFSDEFNFEYLTGIRYGKQGNPAIPTGAPTHKTTLNNRYLQARLNYGDHDKHTAYLQFYHWWHGLDSKLQQFGIQTRDIEEREYDLEFQHTVAWLEGDAETAYGANYRHVAVDSPILRLKDPGGVNGSQTTRDNRFSAFLNQRFDLIKDKRLVKKLAVIAGLRMEGSQFIPSVEWAPRASIMYTPIQNHVLRLTYARAFKLPSFLEEHAAILTPANTGTTARLMGNRDVKREQVHSYEAGYSSLWLDKKLNFDTDFFFAQYQGIIHSTLLQSFVPGTRPLIASVGNAMEANAFGFSVETRYRPEDWLEFFANYSFEHITNEGGSSIARRIDDAAPRHKFNLGANVQLKEDTIAGMPFLDGTSFNVNLHYSDAYTSYDATGASVTMFSIEPNIRMDVRVAKSFLDDGLEVAFVGQNLLSRGHYEASFVQVPRLLYLSVSVRDWPWKLASDLSSAKRNRA